MDNIDTKGIPGSSLIQASADWGLDWMEGARREGGDGEMCRWEGMGFKGGWGERSHDQRMSFSLEVPALSKYCGVNKHRLSCPFLSWIPFAANSSLKFFLGKPRYHFITKRFLFFFVTPSLISAICFSCSMLKWLIFESFSCSFLQVWLQGDALQLDILSGTPRTAAGFLSLLRGSAGQWHTCTQLELHVCRPRLS